MRRPRRLLALLALAALVSAGCSARDGQETGPTGTRARGAPLVLGMISMEQSPLGSFPEVREGAQAAARYANEELDGAGGRPLVVEVCTTTGAPESSQACANRLVAKRPVAVLGGVDLGAGASLPVLARAGVPYVGGSPTVVEELVSPTSFMLTGGTAADLLGQAVFATGTLRAKKVTLVHIDLPGLLSRAAGVVHAILRRQGATEVKVVAEKADAADFTPVLSAVAADRPDVIAVVFPAQGCSRVMQAKAALGVKATMFYPGACAEEAVLAAGGPGADRAYFATGYLPYTATSDPEVATYRRQLRRHGPRGVKPSLLSQTGFSLVMDVRRLLVELDGPPTPAALTAGLRATRDHPSFMGHPYTCDGRQVPLLTSVCSAHVRILQYRSGTLADVGGSWVNGAALVSSLAG